MEHRENAKILRLMCHQMPFWCDIRCKTFLWKIMVVVVFGPSLTLTQNPKGSAELWEPTPFFSFPTQAREAVTLTEGVVAKAKLLPSKAGRSHQRRKKNYMN